ncbi:MAG: hypothetical protein JNK25_08540 [Phycisphaerae bacterium]|nr:hypothetical protein [Phycisphaerae bacterium]
MPSVFVIPGTLFFGLLAAGCSPLSSRHSEAELRRTIESRFPVGTPAPEAKKRLVDLGCEGAQFTGIRPPATESEPVVLVGSTTHGHPLLFVAAYARFELFFDADERMTRYTVRKGIMAP